MCLRIACWIGLGCYIALSATDLFYTTTLLRVNPEAYEANPFAAACIEQHGFRGLAAFKAGGVIAFIGAVVLLLRRRPALGAGVVALGCGVLVWVVMHSHELVQQAHAAPHREAEPGVQWKESSPKPRHGDFDMLEWCTLAMK
jgi:hypothetical protein